jgi:hypothetical protein
MTFASVFYLAMAGFEFWLSLLICSTGNRELIGKETRYVEL